MRREISQSSQNFLPVLLGNLNAPPLLRHPQSSTGSLPERHVSIRYVGYKRGLQHLVEPELPHRSVVEGPLEQRIERRHIQQSLVHVKDTNPLHDAPLCKTISHKRLRIPETLKC